MISKIKDSINTYVEGDTPLIQIKDLCIDVVMGWLFFYYLDVFNFNSVESYADLSFMNKMFIVMGFVGVCNYVANIALNLPALTLKLSKKVFN